MSLLSLSLGRGVIDMSVWSDRNGVLRAEQMSSIKTLRVFINRRILPNRRVHVLERSGRSSSKTQDIVVSDCGKAIPGIIWTNLVEWSNIRA